MTQDPNPVEPQTGPLGTMISGFLNDISYALAYHTLHGYKFLSSACVDSGKSIFRM